MKRFESLQINDRPVSLALFHYEDHFYDAALRQYDFKEALHLYLKRNGYDTIIFFSINKGIHSFEEGMLAFFLNVQGDQPKVQPKQSIMPRVGRGTGRFDLRSHSSCDNQKKNALVYQGKDGIWLDKRSTSRDAQMKQISYNLLNRKNCVVIVEPSYGSSEFKREQIEYLNEVIDCLVNENVKKNNNHFVLLANTTISTGYHIPANIDPSIHGDDHVKSGFWNNPYLLGHFLNNSKDDKGLLHYSLKDVDSPFGSVWVLPCPTVDDCKNAFQYWRLVENKHYKVCWDEVYDVLSQLSISRGEENELAIHSLTEWKTYFKKVNEISYNSFKSFGVQRTDDYRNKLSRLIGMRLFKEWLISFENQIKVDKDFTLKKSHIFLTGNPGTGKTTVAQIIGGCLYELGLLSKNVTVEVHGADLRYNPYKSAAMLVNENVDEALGGVLFIDEAYSMSHSDEGHGKDPHGQEAIDTLTRRLEKDGDKFIAIVAGYEKHMKDWLAKNQGLDRRFPVKIHLDDYNSDELEDIFLYMLKIDGKLIDETGKMALSNLMKYVVKHKPDDFGNAGWVSNLINKLNSIRANRVVPHLGELSNEQINTVVFEDFKNLSTKDTYGWHPSMEKEQEEGDCLQRLNKMVGLKNVKSKIKRIKRTMEYEKKHPGNNKRKKPMHFCFYGNPGTGKTTVAKLLGEILSEYGVCETNKVVCCDRSSLVAQFEGQTAPKTNAVIDSAYGGILFIDEIYLLTTSEYDAFGKEARDTLLRRLEDDRDKFTAVLAGYKKETEDFLSTNSGLKSRITDYIEFEDYTPDELRQIMINLIKEEGFSINQEGETTALAFINETYKHRDNKFGNARWVRTLVEKAIEYMKDRVIENEIEGDSSTVVTEEDIDMTIVEMKKI